ncbi:MULTISPECIES: hypothetical protein [unclassified Mesorhizobium]|uniref:hypothetical protein n=1 Tax=unclassified Mesorhizobium TaxID=325217 RepID=UPI00333CEED8
MSAENELAGITTDIGKIFGKITINELPTQLYAPRLKRLAIEANAILDSHFGLANSGACNRLG